MGRRPAHYRGNGYDRRAKWCRDMANANPNTTCRRCGLGRREGDPWEAGHVIDGDPASPLAPEHRSCNRLAGLQRGQGIGPTQSSVWR